MMKITFPTTMAVAMLVASIAHAQPKPVEKCTGNFEEAQLKEKRGKLVEAEELYAACAAATCPSMVRADCEAKRDEVLKRMPTVTIVVRDPAGNDLAAKIDIDGKPITDRTRATPVDPGEHVVNYKVEGSSWPRSQKIGVVEGEKARVIAITYREGDAKPAPAAAAPPSAETPAPAPAPAPRPQERSEGPAIVGPVILGSVGVILLGGGILMQLLAINEDKKADDLRAQANDFSSANDDINHDEFLAAAKSRQDAAERNQMIALVTGVGGLLFIAGGVTWFFVSKASSSKSAFSPVLAPGYAGASYGLRF